MTTVSTCTPLKKSFSENLQLELASYGIIQGKLYVSYGVQGLDFVTREMHERKMFQVYHCSLANTDYEYDL